MNDYSKKNVLAIGTGIESALVARLSLDVNNCWYYTPHGSGFPKIEDFAKGYGLGNIEKITKPFKYMDKADLFFFGDVGFGDWAQHLRDDKRAVFSAGVNEELEEDRMKARKIQEKIGINDKENPVQYTVEIKGVNKLEKYLNIPGNLPCYVKPYIYRGTKETSHITNKRKAETLIRKLRGRLGPMSEWQAFTVEEEVQKPICEYGNDLFHNGNVFIKPYLVSIENEAPYIAHWRDDAPPSLQHTIDNLEPFFKRTNYRGAFSTEELLVNKKHSKLIDWTCRFLQPAGSGYGEWIKNFTEVIFKVAQGEDVTIDPIAPFIGALPLNAEEAGFDWLDIYPEEKFKEHFKPVYGCYKEGQLWAVKGFTTVITVIAWGKSPKAVVDDLKDLVKHVDAEDLEKETSKLDEILEDIDKLEGMGIEF
jgi:hypothetical protein